MYKFVLSVPPPRTVGIYSLYIYYRKPKLKKISFNKSFGLDLLQHQKSTKSGTSNKFSKTLKREASSLHQHCYNKNIKDNTNCYIHNTIYQQHEKKHNNNNEISISNNNNKCNDYCRILKYTDRSTCSAVVFVLENTKLCAALCALERSFKFLKVGLPLP